MKRTGVLAGLLWGLVGATPAMAQPPTLAGDWKSVALDAGMGCALRKGVVQSLAEAGCGFVPGLMQAMGEYDLVAINDGQLYFGDRAGDLTKARPQTLTAFALQRQ